MIEINGNPYREIALLVMKWCETHYYSDMLVTIKIDNHIFTEFLSFNRMNISFEWENDWYEGQKNDWYEGQKKVILMGFAPIDKIIITRMGDIW